MGSRDELGDVWNASRPPMRGFGYYGMLSNGETGGLDTVYLIAAEGSEDRLEEDAKKIEASLSGTGTWLVRLTPAFLETDEETGRVRVLYLVDGVH